MVNKVRVDLYNYTVVDGEWHEEMVGSFIWDGKQVKGSNPGIERLIKEHAKRGFAREDGKPGRIYPKDGLEYMKILKHKYGTQGMIATDIIEET